MATKPVINPRLLQTSNRLSGPPCVPPFLSPLPSECSPAARSSSPRHNIHHISAPPPLSSTPSTPIRRQRHNSHNSHNSPCSRSLRSTRKINPPVQWGEDTIVDNHASSDNTTNQLGLGGEDEDQAFLSMLAGHDFSSPSTYPSFTADPPAGQASTRFQATSRRRQAARASNPGSATSALSPRRTPACNRVFDAPLQATQLFASDVGEAQNLFAIEDWDEPLSQSSRGSFSDVMPPPQLHNALSGLHAAPTTKQQQSLASDASANNARVELSQAPSVPEDDLFGDSLIPQALHPFQDDDLTTIDLTEATEVPVNLKKPQAPEMDNKIKISKFQCVICMDNASALTVTHCGHLYCAQCLHSSLYVEATKNKCPMCRAKIDIKSRATYNTKTKGFWPLELKLMTATRKGKRKAEDMS